MRRYYFFKSCVDFSGKAEIELLEQMVSDAIPVTLQTIKRHCVNVDGWADERGYAPNRCKGLVLEDDRHISCHRSTFDGERCYFIKWSGIESIWRL